MNTKDSIVKKCKEIESLLLEKNKAYGDAALMPSQIFSKCNATTGIRVRIDDKLKRIQSSGELGPSEDTLLDLAGYLILLLIAKDNENNNIQERIREGESSSPTYSECATAHTGGKICIDYNSCSCRG